MRDAIGEMDSESELGKWLTRAVEHAEHSDPLRHLRGRNGRTLTLYYYGYDKDLLTPDRLNRQLLEAASWRLATELVRRDPTCSYGSYTQVADRTTVWA